MCIYGCEVVLLYIFGERQVCMIVVHSDNNRIWVCVCICYWNKNWFDIETRYLFQTPNIESIVNIEEEEEVKAPHFSPHPIYNTRVIIHIQMKKVFVFNITLNEVLAIYFLFIPIIPFVLLVEASLTSTLGYWNVCIPLYIYSDKVPFVL